MTEQLPTCGRLMGVKLHARTDTHTQCHTSNHTDTHTLAGWTSLGVRTMWIVNQTFIGLHLRICAPLLKCFCEFGKKEKARLKNFDPRQVDFCFSVLTRFRRWMDTKEEEKRLQIVLTSNQIFIIQMNALSRRRGEVTW